MADVYRVLNTKLPPPNPLGRTCPDCFAKPGEQCINTAWGGVRDEPHSNRSED